MNIGKETEQIEFKKSTGELKEGVISIASMLNKHGTMIKSKSILISQPERVPMKIGAFLFLWELPTVSK